MSEELKRPIREKHKPYQGYEIFERYSKAQDKYIDQLESKLKESDQQNKELESKLKAMEELLQYVADNHLCGTPLIEGMKKVGIKEQLIRTDDLQILRESLNK